jgi:ATP-binding protein involved in chromosome partitioning
MSNDELRRSVMAALSRVEQEGGDRDLISSGQVQNLEVEEGGVVRFGFVLSPGDQGDLVKQARAATEKVPGVSAVKVNVQLPQMAPAGGGGRQGGLQPGSVPAPTPKPNLLADVRHVLAVSSGKGGVGKSMVASNLAAAFARNGQTVGLLDADIYGPNIPLMFGEDRRPQVVGDPGKEMIEPLQAHGVRLMSLGFLLDKEQPAIMRGPLITGILNQFLEQVDWGPLDMMVVDMPPGTGDAQLSLVQSIDVDGVVMVTTPQEVATGDVRRGVKMFERVRRWGASGFGDETAVPGPRAPRPGGTICGGRWPPHRGVGPRVRGGYGPAGTHRGRRVGVGSPHRPLATARSPRVAKGRGPRRLVLRGPLAVPEYGEVYFPSSHFRSAVEMDPLPRTFWMTFMTIHPTRASGATLNRRKVTRPKVSENTVPRIDRTIPAMISVTRATAKNVRSVPTIVCLL